MKIVINCQANTVDADAKRAHGIAEDAADALADAGFYVRSVDIDFGPKVTVDAEDF